MIRVRVGEFEVKVHAGHWSGDRNLSDLGRAIEPLGGVSTAFPDADYVRALALAERTGGEVLDPAEMTNPIGGAPE